MLLHGTRMVELRYTRQWNRIQGRTLSLHLLLPVQAPMQGTPTATLPCILRLANNNLTIVTALLEAGADINALTNGGRTSLHMRRQGEGTRS